MNFLFYKYIYNSTEIPRHFIWNIINLDVDNDDIEDDSSANIHFYLKDVIIHEIFSNNELEIVQIPFMKRPILLDIYVFNNSRISH